MLEKTSRPWLHIAEEVGKEARQRELNKLAVLGTRLLMNGPVYPGKLAEHNIDCITPDSATKERINQIIFSELVNGKFIDESRKFFQCVIEEMKSLGCDGVVLGCTEIPLLIQQEDSTLPILDSTRILARAALKEAIKVQEQF